MKLELGLKRVEWGAALFCEPWKLDRRFGKAKTIENRPATTLQLFVSFVEKGQQEPKANIWTGIYMDRLTPS